MTNLLHNISFLTATTVISFAFINSHPVNAALITYNFEVSIDSGFLEKKGFSGFFQFNDSNLTEINEEILLVNNINFEFNGVNYTETDGVAEVVFFDGNFLGLSFSPSAEFSFIPGLFELGEAFFAYNIPGEVDGAGDIKYNPVPEPLTILGTMTAFGFGSLFKRKLKSSSKPKNS